MIDIQKELLIPLRDVPAWCGEHLGNRVHRSTVERWRLRGARGVKLSTILAGGTRYTSVEALEAFFAGVTAAADGDNRVVITGSIDERALKRAEAALDADGIN